MKALFYLVFGLVFLLPKAQISAQGSKVIHQYFVIDAACKKLDLQLSPGRVIVHRTQGTRIMIETHIGINAGNDHLLNFLTEKGRYELLFQKENAEGDKMVLLNKKNNTKVTFRGIECEEKFKFVVYVPESIAYITLNNETIDMTSAAK